MKAESVDWLSVLEFLWFAANLKGNKLHLRPQRNVASKIMTITVLNVTNLCLRPFL